MTQILIAFGFNDPVINQVVPLLSSERDVAKIYWITDAVGNTYDLDGRVEVIDLQEAFETELTTDDLPLTDDAFECYLAAQPVVLKMLDRVEKHGPNLSYHERKYIFERSFTYWWKFIHDHNITGFVCGDVPHEITDYIINEICRSLNLKTICFTQIGTDAIMPIHYYREIGTEQQQVCTSLGDDQKKALSILFDERIKRFQSIKCGESIKLFYINKAWKDQVAQHASQKRTRRFRGKLGKLLNQPFKLSSWRYAFFLTVEKPLLRKWAHRRLSNDYARIASSAPDLSKKYIYLGLHYQPEMTTSPMAEAFVDQYLMAKIILATFPEDVHIYIKEHPNQTVGGRPSHYYKLFPASTRVTFIATDFSSKTLQEHSLAIATVVGTVGFEALWLGKPSLVFGNAYYRNAPGAFHVSTIEEASHAAQQILTGVEPTEEELIKYMRWLQCHVLPANLNSYYAGSSDKPLSAAENAAVMVSEIVCRLRA